MYATSLGGLSGLGTFYKRDLLMTKLMWLSEWVWEAVFKIWEIEVEIILQVDSGRTAILIPSFPGQSLGNQNWED